MQRGIGRVARVGFLNGLGGVDAGGAGAQAKFLQGGGIDSAAGIEAVGRLKFLHCCDGVGIPLAVWFPFEVAAAGERGLNFGDAGRGRRFLKWFTPRAVVMARFFLFGGVRRGGGGAGARLRRGYQGRGQ